MGVIDVIQRLLGLHPPSATAARQRLRLVLAHDRSDLNPELLERMRREILEVVQRYVEIDLDAGEVNLATEDQVTALVANLPIRRALPRPLHASHHNDYIIDDGEAEVGVALQKTIEESAIEPPSDPEGVVQISAQG